MRFIVPIALALPLSALAQSNVQPASAPALTKSGLHSLIATAHSSEQYRKLADYFHRQASAYRAKAAEEKIERDRRAQVNAPLMMKYPRPVDSSQYRFESYSADANQADARAAHYDQMAAGNATSDETRPNASHPNTL